MKSYVKTILSIFSGILIFLSFPKFGVPIFAWVMFVPLFLVIFENKNFWYKTKYTFITGIVGYSGIFYWIITTFKVAGEPVILGVISVFLLSVYFSLYLLIFCLFLYFEISIFKIISLSSLWVLLEYLKSFLFTGFPWMLIGYSQYSVLPLIQIADIGGVYLVSFIVIFVNLVIAKNVYMFIATRSFKQTVRKNFSLIFLTFVMLLGVYLYGINRISVLQDKILSSKKNINVVLLQGNIDQYKKWDSNYVNEIMRSYSVLVSSAIDEINRVTNSSVLFVWPESSVPGWLFEEPHLYHWVKNIVKETNRKFVSYHLVGSLTMEYQSSYNSAVLFSPEGKVEEKYNKIHLVPFGEYVPLKSLLKWLKLSSYISTMVDLGEFSSGKEYTVFKIRPPEETKFSVVICYESIFPELVSKFINSGAELIVNITNDAWFLTTSAPYQHFIFNIFRAVENRCYVFRSANTGISGIISPTGEIIKMSRLFEYKYIFSEVSLYHETTFYTRNSKILWFFYLFIFLVLQIKNFL